uniref:Uncharacterized protein n=1 Tax=Ditylenchus dipsaci TaxID=166011 RepID=A0A915CRF5_9BILA
MCLLYLVYAEQVKVKSRSNFFVFTHIKLTCKSTCKSTLPLTLTLTFGLDWPLEATVVIISLFAVKPKHKKIEEEDNVEKQLLGVIGRVESENDLYGETVAKRLERLPVSSTKLALPSTRLCMPTT